ncbi:hypothetical protein QFZ82_005711 [Streptomyces sp. V4I23]|nr:hypothetical protein [Streptomyces sp. V4I23]
MKHRWVPCEAVLNADAARTTSPTCGEDAGRAQLAFTGR